MALAPASTAAAAAAAREAARRAAAAARAREAARQAAARAAEAKKAMAKPALTTTQRQQAQSRFERLDGKAGTALRTADTKTDAANAALASAQQKIQAARVFGKDTFASSPLVGGPTSKLDRLEQRTNSLASREQTAAVGLDGQLAARTDLTAPEKAELRANASGRLRSSAAYQDLSTGENRVAFAKALNDELQALPADDAAKVLQSFEPQLSEVAKGANGTPSEDERRGIIDSFSEIAEKTGPTGAALLAERFADVAVNDHTDVDDTDQLGGALKASITGGHGAAFAAALTRSLRTRGDDQLTSDVTQATREGIRDVRQDFDEKTAKYAVLDQGLKKTLDVLGPGATKAEQQKAVNDFIDAHQSDYDAFEEQSERLMSVLDGAAMVATDDSMPEDLRTEGADALTRLESAGSSKAGAAKLQEAVSESAYRKELGGSFLDQVSEVSKGLSLPKSLASISDKLAATRAIGAAQVTRAVGNQAVLEAMNGNSSRADQLMGDLKRMHELYGLSADKQAKVVDQINDIMRDRPSPAEVNERLKNLVGADGTAASASDYGLRSLRNLAVVAGIPSVVSGGFGSDDTAKQIQAWSDTVGFGADTVAMTTDLLGRAGSMPGLTSALGKLSIATGLISSGVDLVKGTDALLDGDINKGGAQLLTGLGGSTAAVSAMFALGTSAQVAPVVGQVVGGALILGGVTWSLINGANEENDAEASWEDAYRTLGVDEATAEKLSEADDNDGKSVMPFLVDLRESLKSQPREFADWVRGMGPDSAETLARISKDWQPGTTLEPKQLEALKYVGLVPGGDAAPGDLLKSDFSAPPVTAGRAGAAPQHLNDGPVYAEIGDWHFRPGTYAGADDWSPSFCLPTAP